MWSLPNGANEATPLFHDGVLFVHAFGDKLQALDAATGDLLWQYPRRLPMGSQPSVKRHIVLYGDKVLVATSDAHVVALDVHNGRAVWDKAVADPKAGYTMTGGPTIAKGKVIVGTVGRAPGGNFIVALDANTGEEAWRFNTIAKPGEPGGDSWNGVPLDKRNGGSVWVAGSYDAALNLVYFGVAQTYDTGPYRDPGRAKRSDQRPALYGLHRGHQSGHGESRLALPAPAQRPVGLRLGVRPVDLQDAGRRDAKTVVATSGKQAIYDVVEADTGKYVTSMDLGLQDVVLSVDPRTGEKKINLRLVPSNRDAITVCPHAGGAKSWIPESYNPDTKAIFVPLVESCMDLTPVAARRTRQPLDRSSVDLASPARQRRQVRTA